MPGRYRQTHNSNKSRFYILLSVIFVVVMYKWGILLFMNIIAGSGAERVSTGQDIIPPQTPIISALDEATNSARIKVDGYTEAGANVELILNDKTDKLGTADTNGYFSFDSLLISGQNRIQVRAKDVAGNESMSELSLVTLDTKPVELTVASPKDGSEFAGRNNQVVDIKGSVNKTEAQVLINNSFVSLDADGNFSHRFMLANGENTLTITATDVAGNKAEKTIKLFFAQ